jgi:glutamate/tyrosine decarboxylase-like PLP-dependent enzyme
LTLELNAGEREQLARAAVDWVLRYFAEQSALKVYPTISASELTARLSNALPNEPRPLDVVLREFEQIAAYGRHNGHPRMFGYVQSSGSFAGVVADLLASALNQNVTSWRSAPAATTIEHQVIEWLKQMTGFGAEGTGLLMSGGSLANFAALSVAVRASTDVDINQRGVGALPGTARIYASEMAHMSIPKAAAMLGLGRDAVVRVPVDREYRMDPVALREQIAADRGAGLHPACVVATAGDVNTGAIDPLDLIADVCVGQRVWLHVDGSYGALAAQTSSVAGRMQALGRADSLSLDPHKWLYAPLDAGCLLVKRPGALRRAFSEGASYIDVVADATMSEFAYWDYGPELSRRFRALKIWFLLNIHGAPAIQQAIDANIAVAHHLAALIDESQDFERVAPVPLSIVCFRHRGGDDAFNRRLMVETQREASTADADRLLQTLRRVAARIVR